MPLDWSKLAPHRPLDLHDPRYVTPRELYCRRGDEIARELAHVDTIAITGPVGSGKSTELLRAASRVQRALLPNHNIVTPRARAAWGYIPTDELAGDAIGLHLIADRYLVAYVLDVSGHGVPAALLSVTAMHALAPVPEDTSLLRDMHAAGPLGTVRRPAQVALELNRRFKSAESDGRRQWSSGSGPKMPREMRTVVPALRSRR